MLEAETCGFGASTRNGGFADVSLTHGVLNGLAHWPDDFDTLERLGRDNLDNLLATVDRYAIACHAHRADEVAFATAGWQLDDLTEEAETLRQHGLAHTLMDQSAAQARVHSPTFHGGLAHHDTLALLDPARLVWGLADAVESLGGIIHDGTRVEGIDDTNGRLTVRSGAHTVVADRVIVATNAWAEPIRQMRRYIVPVYDHVLMTEPLTSEQLEAIGWADRAGLNDSGHQFHYYRRTHDDRILWGGYDANYYFGNGMGPEYEDRRSSHELIAGHFFETFPQLEGLGFSHRWAGPIGTTSKFAATYGTRFDGRLSWVGGYTGLGVGASRFGARVRLTWSTDSKPNEPRYAWSAVSRSRFRPSRCVRLRSRPLAGRSRRPTEPARRAGCFAPSPGSAWASTADQDPRSRLARVMPRRDVLPRSSMRSAAAISR